MKITKQQLQSYISANNFLRYMEVQKSGRTNMFAISTVCQLSGLDKKQVLTIMENYSELEELYNM